MSFLVKLVFPAFVTTSFGLGQLGLAKKTEKPITQVTISNEKMETPVIDSATQSEPEQSPASTSESEVTQTPMLATEPTEEQLPTLITASETEKIVETNIETPAEEKGNCQVINAKEGLTGNFPLTESTYISVDCANVVDSESILSKWMGFFPISFFNKDSQSSLSVGKKFDIGIEELDPTDEDAEPYKTIFKSEKFVNKSFTGTWGNEKAEDSEYKEGTIYEVLLTGTSFEKFYLYSYSADS